MSPATALLVPVFVAVVLVAVLAIARLARAWREHEAGGEQLESPEMLALVDEKQRLFETLRDLKQEHSLGKLSESDYLGLERHFEREALRVIDRLEQLRGASTAERGSREPT